MVSKEGQEVVGQGRLLPDSRVDRQGRAEQGPVGGDQLRSAARGRAGIAGPPARRLPGPHASPDPRSTAGRRASWWSAASSSSPPSSRSCSSSSPRCTRCSRRRRRVSLVGRTRVADAGGARAEGRRSASTSTGRSRTWCARTGALRVRRAQSGGRTRRRCPIAGLDGAQVARWRALGKGRYLIGTSDGRVIPLEMKFDVDVQGRRSAAVTAAARSSARPPRSIRTESARSSAARRGRAGLGRASRWRRSARASSSCQSVDREEGADRREPARGIAAALAARSAA